MRYFTRFIPLFFTAKILQPVSASPCWQTEAVLAVFVMLYVGKRAKRTVICRRCVVAGRVLIVFLSMKAFAPSRRLVIAPVGLSSHPSLIDICETSTGIRFALLRLFHCLLPPNHCLLPPNHRLLPPNYRLLPPNEKTLSGARQLFVFRRKRSDVRHTISLSRRSRFLTPLIDLRHRERQKGGGGVKGLHSSLHW